MALRKASIALKEPKPAFRTYSTVMSTESLSGETISDHDLTIAIPGDVAGVRARLVEALQQVGYKIIAERAIHAVNYASDV